MLPQAMGVLLALWTMNFIDCWNDYMTVVTWLPSYPNLAFGMFMFQTEAARYGAGMPHILAGFVVAGLGVRFHWYILPKPIVSVAAVVFLVAYILYAEVLRENTYLSRTIEVQENQKVIDVGLYGIIRHPMYFATILLYLSFPIVLGSWISFIVFLIFPFVLAKRIKNEEKVLEEGLEGYIEYKKKVKYRLIPFIW